jgi:hypothetical protein
MFEPKYFYFAIGFLAIRTILSFVILTLVNKKLQEKKLIHVQLFYEIVQPILNFILLIFARRKKELLWK